MQANAHLTRSDSSRHPFPSLGALISGLTLLLLSAASLQAVEVPFLPQIVDDKIPGARDAIAADVDGDGDGDIIAGATGGVGIVLYRNTAGDGSVWSRLDVDSNFDGVFAVAIGDMNGDSHPDILGVAHTDNDISWWENNGDGTVWTRRDVDLSFNGASDIEAADIDGDGDLDIVATADGADDVAWWENTDGVGTSWTKRNIDTNFDAARAVKAADLDNDGDLDVVATGDFVSAVVWWENTSGDGLNWTEETIDFTHSGGSGVDVADMDGDGDIDVFGSSEVGDEITWYENPTNSAFAAPGAEADDSDNFGSWIEHTIDDSLNGAFGLHVTDLDADGDLDVIGAARNESGGSNIDLAYYENQGDNVTFSKRRVAGFFDNARSAFSFDIDKDGDLDLMSASTNLTEVSWWMSETIHGTATFPEESLLEDNLDGSRSVKAGDVDGDGDLDIIACAFNADEVSWWENTNGDGSNWAKRIVDQAFDGARSVDAEDMDGDGDLDIVGVAQFDNDIAWYENTNGVGTAWTKHIVETNFLGARRAVVGDIDSDGDVDILAAAADAKDITWYRNNGDGSTFTPDIIEDNYDRALSTFAADIDGDGDLDALGAADSIDDITWWENQDGLGMLWSVAQTIDPFYSQPGFVSAADMDCDGDMDVLGAAEGGDEVTWWENDNGDGSAWTKHTIDFFNQATSLLAADFDQDGDLDILGSAFKDGGKIHVWFNEGDALTWTELVITDAFFGAGWVEAADMDGDGDLDIMATAENDDDLSYWDNRGGQFTLMTLDTSGNTLGNSVTEDVLRIIATHNGLPGEQDMELTSFELLFEETPGVPLSSAEANGIVESLFVYRDTGDGIFNQGSDTLVTTITNLSLVSGVQTVGFADGDGNVAVSQGTPRTFFVVVETTSNYDSQPLATVIISHVTEASSSAEDADHDIPLTLEFAFNTPTGVIPVNASTARADLVITKTDNPDPVTAGGTLVYTIRVDNNGPDDALDVVVTDTLPAGVTLVSTSGCAEDPNAVPTCNLGTIANGSFKSYTITVTVNSNTFGNITNTASVTSSTAEDNPGDETDSATTTSLAPTATADLSITKVDSPDPVDPGGTLTYTLTVTNNGPDTANNVVITDNLPASLSLVSSTGCNEDPSGVPTCTVGTLTNGQSAMVTLVTSVSGGASGTINNTASVASSASDPNSGNNTAVASTTVTASQDEADLSLTKVDSPDPVDPGGTLTYTLTVTNNGPDSADNVVITDNLPSSLTLVSSTGCNEDPNGAPTCTLGTLSNGQSAMVTLVTSVSGDASGSINNVASVASSTFDPDGVNNTAGSSTSVTAPSGADLSLTKTDSPDPVDPGGTLTYTLTVTNNGPDSADNVVITDNLPASLSLVSSTGCNEDPNGAPTCTIGTLGSGQSAMVTLVTSVSGGASGTINNTASVTSSTSDPNSANNTASASTSVTMSSGADLSLTKTDSPDPVDPGGQLSYTLTVTNNGPDSANNVVITDNLPASVSLLFSNGCNEDPFGAPTCTIGTLGSGQNAVVTLVTTVSGGASGTINNTASVASSTSDPNSNNNTASTSTSVTSSSGADLSLTKTDNPDPVDAGSQLTYTITVNNAGPDAAENVVVTDTLPSGVTFVATSGCNEDPAGVPTCTLGTIGSGSNDSYTIMVNVDAGTLGVINNTASVTSSTPETNPGDESDTEDTTVVKMGDPTADLQVTKLSFPSAHTVGQTMRYTVVVDNLGPSDANGSTVTDLFPAAVTGINWTCAGTNGGICSAGGSGDINGQLVFLPAGARVTFTAIGTVTGSDTSITNTASATVPAGVVDPNSSNDTDSVTTQTDDILFFDSFESGDFSAWDDTVPAPREPGLASSALGSSSNP